MSRSIYALGLALLFFACSGDNSSKTEQQEESQEQQSTVADDGKGFGPVKTVSLNSPLDQERISRGKAIYEMKCQACHRLDNQRVVGPGWKDVTKKRKPEWIMNMIVNIDEMLEKDPEAQKLMEEYLMKMPNQNVTTEDARDLLEFMRQNDGEK